MAFLLQIFEPFYRGTAAANYKVPGTGLGLAIAQRLIDRLRGHIIVESSLGRGLYPLVALPQQSAG